MVALHLRVMRQSAIATRGMRHQSTAAILERVEQREVFAEPAVRFTFLIPPHSASQTQGRM